MSLVLTAVVFAVTPGGEALAKRKRARPFAVRAHVVDFEKTTHPTVRRRQRSFEGYETHTLEFDVFRRGRSTVEQAIEVALYLPNGDLYRVVALEPFEAGETNENGRRRKRRAPAATGRVRVSGTVITRYSLYGDWRADICWTTGTVKTCQSALKFDIF